MKKIVTVGPLSLMLLVQEKRLRDAIRRHGPALPGLVRIGKCVGFDEDRLDDLRAALVSVGVICADPTPPPALAAAV
jgi:hypothetical protein